MYLFPWSTDKLTSDDSYIQKEYERQKREVEWERSKHDAAKMAALPVHTHIHAGLSGHHTIKFTDEVDLNKLLDDIHSAELYVSKYNTDHFIRVHNKFICIENREVITTSDPEMHIKSNLQYVGNAANILTKIMDKTRDMMNEPEQQEKK